MQNCIAYNTSELQMDNTIEKDGALEAAAFYFFIFFCGATVGYAAAVFIIL